MNFNDCIQNSINTNIIDIYFKKFYNNFIKESKKDTEAKYISDSWNKNKK